MKKGKLLVLGLIALLLAGGLVLASCGPKDCGDGCNRSSNDCGTLCEGRGLGGPASCGSSQGCDSNRQ
jgi:hypothetical protein